MKKRYIFIGILVILIGTVVYLSTFKYTTIQVTGCVNSDETAIRNAVNERGIGNNTILLYLSNLINPIEGIAFVDDIDIDYISKHEIAITVYEKSLAGCIEYMNSYIYFDKDGYVLESSDQTIEGVPCIRGLGYEQWEIGERLPIKDENKFQTILTITQLIEKYKLSVDGIKFTAENEIVLSCGSIDVELGEGEYLEIQMMNLGSILEGLQGMKGTLYMKDFDSDEATASFNKK